MINMFNLKDENNKENIFKQFISKRIIIIFFLFSLIFLLLSCESTSTTELKRINLFSTNYQPNQVVQKNEVYPKEPGSYIFYRKYYIYFYDGSSRTIYKYTRTGKPVLTIQNSSFTASGFGIDKEKVMRVLLEDERTTKITRTIPLPEVIGLSVDFNDNIFLKVTIKGTSGNRMDDCSGFLNNYSDKDHPVYFLFNENQINPVTSILDSFDKVYAASSKIGGQDIILGRYYTFYMMFNQYGDFMKVIGFCPNHPDFPMNSILEHTKEGFLEGSNKDGKKQDGVNYIHFLMPTAYENEGLPSALANVSDTRVLLKFTLAENNSSEEISQALDMISIDNGTNGNTIDQDIVQKDISPIEQTLPDSKNFQKDTTSEPATSQDNSSISSNQVKTNNLQESEIISEEEKIDEPYYPYIIGKENNYYYFSLKDLPPIEKNSSADDAEFGVMLISPDGLIATQVLFFNKGYIVYDTLYNIKTDQNNQKITLAYNKQLYEEKVEDGKQSIKLSIVDTYLGSPSGGYFYYVRYLEKMNYPAARLIIKDSKMDTITTRMLNVKEITSIQNMVVGENGSIYGFYIKKDKAHFFYYAAEIVLNKIKM